MRFATPLSRFIRLFPLCLLFMGLSACQPSPEKPSAPPNILLIYMDDLGYGDLSSYGSPTIKTPHIDALAESGKRLTQYYVASPVCSPSRAALMTGCYPFKVGIPQVLAPHGIGWAADRWRTGLNHEETTLAEGLKTQGYATAIVGKWHLGHMPEHLPTQHGFDYFYGIPYSNDMRPENNTNYPPLPIIENDKIVAENPDQGTFTMGFADKAIEFMDTHQDGPFFVYLAHPMPHVPLYVGAGFDGKSEGGMFGDVVEEVDASVGKIINYLEEKGLRENTLVIFTSDNGPWLAYGNHAGSAGELREGKFTTMEGGQRVPCIISWPARIQPEVSDALVSNMDLLPTLLNWAGASQPEKAIDGIAMNAFFEGKGQASGREEFLYYSGKTVHAMRQGKWKLHQPHRYQKIGQGAANDGERGKYERGEIGWALFDMEVDPREQNNLLEQYPEVVTAMKARMLEADSLHKAGMRQPFVYEGEMPEVGKLWHGL